jgi:hypothetical protein
MALRDEPRRLILEFAPERASALADGTPPITSFDLAAEWDSVTDIRTFIERHQAPPSGTTASWIWRAGTCI